MRARGRWPAGRILTAGACAALALWVCGAAPRGFFSGDSGVKLAQAHALWTTGHRALPYDRAVDPHGRYFPYGVGTFVRRVDGSEQGIYSLVFTGVAAPLVGLLGRAGLVPLPLLGGFLIALGTYLLGRRLGAPSAWAGAAATIAVLATPVLLYSAQFSEHTLAAGAAVLALVLVLDERPLAAGLLAALAACVRAEGYCVVAAVGLAVAAHGEGWRLGTRARRSARYLAGCVPALLAYWIANRYTAGTWDPAVAINAHHHASLRQAIVMLLGEMRGPRAGSWAAALLAPVVAGLIPMRRGRSGLGAGLALCAAALVAVAAWRAQQLSSARALAGLFAVTPLAALGFLAGPYGRTRAPWLFALVYIVQVLALDKSGTGGGLQLGARLLMPALPPLLALAAARAATLPRAAGLAPAVLLALSVWGMRIGLPAALRIARDGGRAAAAAAASPARDIVARRWWESQLMTPALLDGKRIYLAPGDPAPLLAALSARGASQVTYVSRGATRIALAGGRVAHTTRRWSGWLEVQLIEW